MKRLIISMICMALAGCSMSAEDRAARDAALEKKYAHISDKSLCFRRLDASGSLNGLEMARELERRKADCYDFEEFIAYREAKQARRSRLQAELINYGRPNTRPVSISCQTRGSRQIICQER